MPEASRRIDGGTGTVPRAAWIAGGVVVVLLVVGVSVAWWLLNDTPPDLVDAPDPPTEAIPAEEVTVEVEQCRRLELSTIGTDRFGETLDEGDQGDVVTAEASGTLTNTSDQATGYDIVIQFEGDAGRRLDVGRTLVPQVAPGASASWMVRSHRILPEGDDLTCTVASVARPRLEGGAAVPGT